MKRISTVVLFTYMVALAEITSIFDEHLDDWDVAGEACSVHTRHLLQVTFIDDLVDESTSFKETLLFVLNLGSNIVTVDSLLNVKESGLSLGCVESAKVAWIEQVH